MFGVKLGGGLKENIGVGVGGSAGASLGVSLPSVATTNEAVTLRSKDGAGFGFELGSDARGGLVVSSVSEGGPAKESGLIHPGDQLGGINIDAGSMGLAGAQAVLSALAKIDCPLTFNVKRPVAPGAVGLSAGVKVPDVGVSGEIRKPETDIKLPDAKISGEFKGPHIDAPDLGVSGRLTGPEVNLPRGGIAADITGPHIDIPYANIEGSIPGLQARLPDAAVNGQTGVPGLPNVGLSGEVAAPEAHIQGIGISGELKGPNVQVPSFGLAGNGKTPSLQADLTGVGVSGDVKAPQISAAGGVTLPKSVELGGGISGEIDLPKVKAPHADLDIRHDDINIALPKVDLTGTAPAAMIGGVSGAINAELPDVEVDIPDVDVHVKGPSFGSKVRGFFRGDSKKKKKEKEKRASAGADLNVNLPNVEIGGAAEAELKGPQPTVNVNVELPHADIKLPDPTANIDIKTHTPHAELKTQTEIPNVDFHADLNTNGAKIKKPKAEGGFKMHMPKINFGRSGKYSLAEANAELETPALNTNIPSADINVALPEPHIEGNIDIQGPNTGFGAGIDIKAPKLNVASGAGADVEIEGPKGGIGGGIDVKGPKIDVKGPKLDVGGGAGIDVDVKGPKGGIGGDIDVKGPKIDVKGPKIDVKGPKIDVGGGAGVDVDVDKPKGGGKFDIHLPKFGFGGKAGADVDVDVDAKGKLPKGKGDVGLDVNIGLPSVDVDVKGPKGGIGGGFDVKGPKVDVGGGAGVDVKGGLPKGKGQVGVDGKGEGGLKLELPKLSLRGRKSGDADLVVGAAKAYVDADVGSADLGFSASGPSVGLQVDSPDADVSVKGNTGKRKSFGSKMKGLFSSKSPSVDVAVSGTSPSFDLETSERAGFSVGAESPGVEMGVDVPSPTLSAGVSGNVKGKGFKGDKPSGLHADVDVRSKGKAGVGVRPQSSIEGRSPRGGSLSSSSSSDIGPGTRLSVGAELSPPRAKGSLFGTGPRKKEKKDRKTVESALRMGLPTVSVAAGNFDSSSSHLPSAALSHDTTGSVSASLSLDVRPPLSGDEKNNNAK